MDPVIDAARLFFDHLAAVEWRWVVLGVLCHLAKTVCRSMAWRNVLAAAYPDAEVRRRDIYGAYAAGVGVNAVVPVRGGDLVKLFLAKRSIDGATYPTLASSLVVETIFDVAVSVSLLIWAAQAGVIPGVNAITSLRAHDLVWVVRHPYATAAIAVGVASAATFLAWRYSRHVVAFKDRLVQGFSVLHDRRLYFRSVVTWQAADWVLRIFTIYCFLHAFNVAYGLAVTTDLGNALLVQVSQSISTLFPVTPAGIGTEQALVAYVLAGKASTTALVSFSVGMKLVLVAVNVAVGFGAIFVMLGTLRWRRHIERVEEAA